MARRSTSSPCPPGWAFPFLHDYSLFLETGMTMKKVLLPGTLLRFAAPLATLAGNGGNGGHGGTGAGNGGHGGDAR